MNQDQPIATIDGAVFGNRAKVTVIRRGQIRNYWVDLNRYKALFTWTAFGDHPWCRTGSWNAVNMFVSLWDHFSARGPGHRYCNGACIHFNL